MRTIGSTPLCKCGTTCVSEGIGTSMGLSSSIISIITWRRGGASAALLAAVLFGVSTPVAKLFVADMSPWMLAGLLYLGSGVGLALAEARSRRASCLDATPMFHIAKPAVR